MKTFEIRGIFYPEIVLEFTEDTPPSWLASSEYNWWWKAHVLTLNPGESIKSDFQEITRTT